MKPPFDPGYFEGVSEDYLDGVRPDDEPRPIIKDSVFVISLVALFVFLGFVAVRYF